MKTLEERVVRLEEEVYFQESLLRDLNDALARQQKEVDGLLRLTERLSQQLAALKEAVASQPVQTRPPHYLPEILS